MSPRLSPILPAEELEDFTRKTERAQKRYGSQEKVLIEMGIPYLKRPDGTLIVYRINVEPRPPQEKQESVPSMLP